MHFLIPFLLRVITLWAIVALFAGCSAEARKTRILDRADKFYRAGELENAKVEYLNVLKLEPKNTRANERLGLICLDQGAPLRAGPYLLTARDAAPNDHQIRAKVGLISLAVGKVASARREALTILERSPGHEEALILLAESIRTAEDYQRAEQELRNTTYRGTTAYHLATANLHLRRGDAAGARRALQRAVTIDAKSPAVHSAFASFHQWQNNPLEAEKALKTAAELAPVRSAARLRYADFKAKRGAYDEALAYLKDITQAAPDYLPAWTGLAHIALAQKKYEEAVDLLQNVISRDPENYEAHVLRARIALARGETQKGIEELERIGSAYPGLAIDKYHLALVYLEHAQPAKAAEALRSAIAAQPDHDEAVVLLAELNLKAGQPEPVVAAMVGLLTRRPTLVKAQVLLADALRILGRPDDAIHVIREQIRVMPQSGQPHFLLGVILLEQKKSQEARAAFERSLALAPDYLPAVARLVDLDLQEKNFVAAQNRARVQLAKTPESADAQFLVARIYAAQARWKEANVGLRKAIELDDNHSAAYGLLLYGMISNRELPQAIQELETLRAKTPTNLPVLLLSGAIYLQLNEPEKARDAYEKLLSVRPNASLALNNLACLYADRLNQLDRALELARRARELEPTSPAIADTLGWILFQQKDYASAAEFLKEASVGLPESAEVQFHFAMASEAVGNLAAARSAFEKAAVAKEDFPGKEQIKERLARLKRIPASPRRRRSITRCR